MRYMKNRFDVGYWFEDDNGFNKFVVRSFRENDYYLGEYVYCVDRYNVVKTIDGSLRYRLGAVNEEWFECQIIRRFVPCERIARFLIVD